MTNGQAISNFNLCSILANSIPLSEKGNISAWAIVKLKNFGKLAEGLKAQEEEIRKIDNSDDAVKEFLDDTFMGVFNPINEAAIMNLGIFDIPVMNKTEEGEVKSKIDSLYILTLLSENGIIK